MPVYRKCYDGKVTCYIYTATHNDQINFWFATEEFLGFFNKKKRVEKYVPSNRIQRWLDLDPSFLTNPSFPPTKQFVDEVGLLLLLLQCKKKNQEDCTILLSWLVGTILPEIRKSEPMHNFAHAYEAKVKAMLKQHRNLALSNKESLKEIGELKHRIEEFERKLVLVEIDTKREQLKASCAQLRRERRAYSLVSYDQCDIQPQNKKSLSDLERYDVSRARLVDRERKVRSLVNDDHDYWSEHYYISLSQSSIVQTSGSHIYESVEVLTAKEQQQALSKTSLRNTFTWPSPPLLSPSPPPKPPRTNL